MKNKPLQALVKQLYGSAPPSKETKAKLVERILDAEFPTSAPSSAPSSSAQSSSSSSSSSHDSGEEEEEASRRSGSESSPSSKAEEESRKAALPPRPAVAEVPVIVEANGFEPRRFDQPYHFALESVVDAWSCATQQPTEAYELLDEGAPVDASTATPETLKWAANVCRKLRMRKRA